MDAKIKGGCIYVTLSRRNLTDLLTAIAKPSTDRTLIQQTAIGPLRVTVEADAAHYANRVAGPGLTYPGCKDFASDDDATTGIHADLSPDARYQS